MPSTTTKRVICVPVSKSVFRHALSENTASVITSTPDLLTFTSIGVPIHNRSDDFAAAVATTTTRRDKSRSSSAKRSQQKSSRNNKSSDDATASTTNSTTTNTNNNNNHHGRGSPPPRTHNHNNNRRQQHHKQQRIMRQNQRLCAASIPSLLSSSSATRTCYYARDSFTSCCTSCGSTCSVMGGGNPNKFPGCKYLYRSDFAQHVRYENGCFTMQERVYLPDNPHFKIIGRLLGPRGYSLRQLEAEAGCRIVIRGKGSVKEKNKEARLRGQPGWEHLDEPLHVLISAHHQDQFVCAQKLHYAVHCIKSLLTPRFDAYKREQLLQLSIINGTYQPRS